MDIRDGFIGAITTDALAALSLKGRRKVELA